MADIELGPGDDGGRRSVGVGDLVTARLPESPTTGYRWSATFDAALLEQVGDSFSGDDARRGGGGVRVLVFRAVASGTTTLRLVNARSWSPEGGGDRLDVVLVIGDS